ncbi:MAG: MFS transporter [Bacteroidia bacterium]|nr:MFS transporter [Bacteroidia bacterium]MCZ2249581.1 MFS transporter [Bacteroidia bacterium]
MATSIQSESKTPNPNVILFLTTLAFTICFAAWMFNGVMVTFLVDKGVFNWGAVQIGWLLGIPVLVGSVMRLPMGILTDKLGGRFVFTGLLLFCAIPMFFLSKANDFASFALLSFGYGMAGSGFSVGVAYTSVWYSREWQGRALGIFGVGNAGSAITTLLAPTILNKITNNGADIEQWRILPQIYAAVLVIMAVIFFLFTVNKKPQIGQKTVNQMLKPLGNVRVWRFGLYYFLVFGCFVAFSQWLVPYFVNVYGASLVVAGLFAALFSMPSGLIRAVGGWMSDRWGARKVMISVFIWSIFFSALLIFPKMDILTPGKGVIAIKDGQVTSVTESVITVDQIEYPVKVKQQDYELSQESSSVFPHKNTWQTPVVKEGEMIKKKQLLAQGTSHIHFSANMWVYAVLVLLIGIVWGIGKASVYKFIPDYFPNDIGAVGGMVGVIGGLGGFICPIIFGYLLEWTGLWTSCWFLMLLISIVCFMWMKRVVRGIMRKHAPHVADDIEHKNEPIK